MSRGKVRRHVRHLDDKGAAAVEFALLLPIMVLLIFALIDFGRLFFVQISLTSASREAVRTSSFVIDGCLNPSSIGFTGIVPNSDPCKSFGYMLNPALQTRVNLAVEGAAVGVKGISQLDSDSAIEVKIVKPCSAIPTISETQVNVEIVFDWLLPLNIGSNDPYKIKSSGYMKCFD